MSKKQIGFIVGSLREGSYNKKIAKVMAKFVPEAYEVNFIEIGDLPFYNEDIDVPGKVPASWQRFRDEIAKTDAFIFFTPEYNRSLSAVIKNAIDVGSRPYGENLWDGKTAAVVSSSVGAISGFAANHHLRQALVFVNMHTMAQPEAYLADTGSMFDDNDNVKNQGTEDFLKSIVTAFIELHERLNK